MPFAEIEIRDGDGVIDNPTGAQGGVVFRPVPEADTVIVMVQDESGNTADCVLDLRDKHVRSVLAILHTMSTRVGITSR